MNPEPTPEELLMISANDPCFCASGKVFRFCCFRIADKIIDALVLADEGKFKKALKTLEDAEAVPESSEIHGIRAQVLSMMEDYEGAERELALAFDINPNYPRGYFIRANNFFEDGDFDQALALYDKAVEFYPANCKLHISEVLASKGYCCFHLKDYAAAKDTWLKGLEINPEDIVIPSLMYENIYDNPNVPEEISRKDEFYYRCIEPVAFSEFEDSPDNEADDIGEAGFDEDIPEEYDLSPEIIDKINELVKGAIKNIDDENTDKAIEMLEEALDLYPLQPDALTTLNYLYASAGEIENSMDCLYELAEIADNPRHIITALSGITTFKLMSGLTRIFPLHFSERPDGDTVAMKTSRLLLANPEKALKNIEEFPMFVDKVEKNQGTEFLLSENKPQEDKPLGSFFFVRLYPEKKCVYMDTLFHDKYDEFMKITLEMLGDSVTGAPSEFMYTTPFAPTAIDNVLTYDDEEELPDELEYEEMLAYEIIPTDDCVDIANDFCMKFFEHIWLNTPAPGLGGLTPLESRDDEFLEPVIPAVIDAMEEFFGKALEPDGLKYDFNRLRKELSIPAKGPRSLNKGDLN